MRNRVPISTGMEAAGIEPASEEFGPQVLHGCPVYEYRRIRGRLTGWNRLSPDWYRATGSEEQPVTLSALLYPNFLPDALRG